MSSVKTMACPYGQGKWRNTSNDTNYTGSIGSRYRPPLVRLDSTGEINSTGFVTQQHSLDSEMTRFQKSHSSMLNIRDWIVGKFVNSESTRTNLTMSDRPIDSVKFGNSLPYDTMPQTRPFIGQSSVGHSTEHRWHPKPHCFSFQQPRFNSDFRIFPCHQFEFYNNIKNTMDMHAMGPALQQNFVGFQKSPHDQNFRSRNKHVYTPPRKVLKRERDNVLSSPVPNSRQQSSDHNCDNLVSPHKVENMCSSSQRCTVKDVVQCENCYENVHPELDLELTEVKDKSKVEVINKDTSTDIKMGNVTNCTADDASVLKGDSDSITESLIDGLTNIVLNDVDVGKACSAVGKRKIQDKTIGEAAQNTNEVLLLRKTCKKGRPSAKKQRKRKRQRARLCDSPAKTDDNCDINNKILQGTNPAQNKAPSRCQNACKQQFGCSTIAFILGYHSMPDAPDDDDVDSFSECDSGDEGDFFCDMNECDIAAAIPQCNLTSVLPQHNKSKLSYASTSLQPDVGEITSKLDAINSSWNIQISRNITDARETKCTKKVY